jgi:hypothetical protein
MWLKLRIRCDFSGILRIIAASRSKVDGREVCTIVRALPCVIRNHVTNIAIDNGFVINITLYP